MNDKQREFVGVSFIEMYQSLLDSVKKAGGQESSFYYDEIKNTTVAELISRLATNGIRFTHVSPEDQKEELFDSNKFREELDRNKLFNSVFNEEHQREAHFKIGSVIRLELIDEDWDYILTWTGENNAYLVSFRGIVWSKEPIYTERKSVSLKHLEDFLYDPKRYSRPANFYKVADSVSEYFEKTM